MSTPAYYQPLRRVVTGVDHQGRSCAVSDATAGDLDVASEYVLDDLWSTGLPAPVAAPLELPGRAGAEVAPGTILWRRCTIPGRTQIGLHSTDTVDWVTVLSGKVALVLETGEVALAAGDCVVQRSTVHGWHNRSTEPCVLIAAMASTAG